jgi:hypothetical protein
MHQNSQTPYTSPAVSSQPSSWLPTACAALSIFTGLATLFLVLAVGPVIWILKDGLGPEATESLGFQALNRMFWTFYWGPITSVTALAFCGSLFWLFRLGRRNHFHSWTDASP